MIVELTEGGSLYINGETSLERYALNKWFADFTSTDSDAITGAFGVNQDIDVSNKKQIESKEK